MSGLRITCVVGARPNFVEITPVLGCALGLPDVYCRLVHTGQHYDERMSKLFFTKLDSWTFHPTETRT